MKILNKGTYYGSQNFLRSYNGILLSHYEYTGAKTEWHYHENPYFMYVTKGNMIDGNARAKTLCPAGSLMYNNWQEEHYGAKHSIEASGFHLEFEQDWLNSQGISMDLLEGSHLIDTPQVHLLFSQLFQEFIMNDSYADLSVELLLVQICDALNGLENESTENSPSWILSLKELLREDLADYSLSYLSDQLDVHPVHISRTASKYLNMSLGKYIRLQKLQRAIPMVLDPTKSLTQVSYDAGFSDQSHFTRVFKGYYKSTPKQFRKSYKVVAC